MEIRFTDNIKSKLIDILKDNMPNALHTRISVAFAKLSGYNLIRELIDANLNAGNPLEMVLGLDFKITEPQLIRELLSNKQRNLPVDFCCFSEPRMSNLPVFHPKLYTMSKKEEVVSVIGSSNLTKGGLSSNIEVNTIIKSKLSDEITSDIIDLFNRIKYHGMRFIPDETYIDNYETVYEINKTANRKKIRSANINQAIKELKEQEKNLPRPELKPEQLSGWMKAVFDRLPDKEFTNQEIYKYKEEFKGLYPENEFIEEKIRQQLQFLHKLGLLTKIRRNLWKKRS